MMIEMLKTHMMFDLILLANTAFSFSVGYVARSYKSDKLKKAQIIKATESHPGLQASILEKLDLEE